MKPLIVISPSYKMLDRSNIPPHVENSDTLNFNYLVGWAYVDAIARAGGIPILATGGNFAELAQRADAVLFSGGVDVDPALYKESIVNDTVSVDPRRDRDELALFSAFYDMGKPIFGICRGIQLINVALGGSLWQDIPSQMPDALVHNEEIHPVHAEAGSLIRQVMGEDFMTNSYHHQAVKTPGYGMRVTATAADGTVEAIEHERMPIFATQFHPERMTGGWKPDTLPDTAPLFFSWMEIANRYRKQN